VSPRSGETLEPLEPEDSEWLDAIAGRTTPGAKPGTSVAQEPPPDRNPDHDPDLDPDDDPFADLSDRRFGRPGEPDSDTETRSKTRSKTRGKTRSGAGGEVGGQAGQPLAGDEAAAVVEDEAVAGDEAVVVEDEVVDGTPVDRDVDPERLQERVEVLGRLIEAVGERLPGERLQGARLVVERAGKRLGLSGRHTVVALAGATGSGKSSLYNALSGLDLSRVGVRRPTTGEPHACVWDPADTQALLDWLGVLPTRRTARESALDGDEQVGLRGLVLVDLPDFDSIVAAHRRTVDRLVDLVDLVIWVLDPQKYADRVVHERYLRQLATRRTATVVVLNQVDRLNASDAARCADDLRRLLAGDGLGAAPLYLTSVRSRAGLPELRSVLVEAVSSRQTALRRLAADVDRVVDGLANVVGPPAAEDAVDREGVRALSETFARMIGVPGAADAGAQDYRRRGLRLTSWPPARLSLPSHAASRELEQETYNLEWLDGPGGGEAGRDAGDVDAAGADVPTDGGASALGRPLRALAERVGGRLPAPWHAAIRAAATSRTDALRSRLERVVRDTAGPDARPRWWQVVNVLQWVLAGLAAAGLLWLVADLLSGPLGYDLATPQVGPLSAPTVLFVGGLLAGVVLWLPSVPLVRRGARDYRRGLEQGMRAAVTEAVREHVVAPVRAELHAYAAAHAAHQILHSGQDGDRGRAVGEVTPTA
jgi:predicted GTPase